MEASWKKRCGNHHCGDRDWPSYSCSASHRRHPKVPRRHRSSDHKDNTCYEREETEDVVLWTNTVVVLALRLILMKIIVFNTLMTIYAVIKW
ncbi:T-cell receptor alpha chain C region [Dissostichus eleginoides]|nr:T-cell receptor alpha chain C region [Dissostichus eleginoides]